MDPELLQLFASARGANKNVSGLLGNIDNPLLAFLAGVYDPVSAQGQPTGGALWAKYSQDPNPVFQQIIQEIQNGADPFYLSSEIDKMGDDVASTGLMTGDLKGLAKALHKEYTTSGDPKNMSVWAKAGLREPTDLYSTQDVPLGDESRKQIVGMREGQVAADRKLSTAQTQYGKVRSQLSVEDKIKEQMIDRLNSNLASGPYQSRALAEWISQQDVLDENQLRNKAQALSVPEKEINKATKTLSKRKNKVNQTEYTKSQYDVGSASMQSDAAKAAERLYREGLVSSYEAAGKTPTRDQLAGIMSFLSQSK
jgi:flagellar motility protein MotE (MotC chaperone)